MARLHAWGRRAAWTLAVLAMLAALAMAGALWAVHRSVPTLDGQVRLPGLSAPLTVRRDALGTAVVGGANRLDVARGLGFVHAQERFFEMDLARRSAAGELSALFGSGTLDHDRARRVHRMRAMLVERYARMEAPERALLQAYSDGVNAGLAQLGTRPWQYLLLQVEPRPWQPVDSLLVIGEMFWKLQGDSVDAGFGRALLRDKVGSVTSRVDWLDPQGGHWDAPLDGSRVAEPPLPGPDWIDLRRALPVAAARAPAVAGPTGAARELLAALDGPPPPDAPVGSNNWAVGARRSTSHDAMLANDMHLGLSAPSIWFRAQFEIGQGPGALRAEGVTLPGVPALVAGSNGAIAWGFTNAYGRWFDWIRVPEAAAPARTTHVVESIRVKGGVDVALDVALFDGAPVARERDHRAYALRWIADSGDAYNLGLDALLSARDVDGALDVARRAGIPQQNIVIADRDGHIAWTVAGRLWDGDRAEGAPFAETPAPGWLDPAGYPGIKDPVDGQLWTANARALRPAAGRADAGQRAPTLDGHAIGDGGFDLGARARQIRDRLAAVPQFDEASLAAIQMDDEARFLLPWAGRIAGVAASETARPEVTALLMAWNGRADADQAAYRLVRSVRLRVLDALWVAWTTPILGAAQADPQRRLNWRARFEYSAERALDERPAYLLPRPFASWDAFLLAQIDATVAEMTLEGRRPLARATWGEANRSAIRNVLSRAVPGLARWLDMPASPQAGDANMPHVAGPGFGQSERLVVAPGHEERGTLSMPGGQSGHPMSPYYGAGHGDWVAGRATPLLAGTAQHTLSLVP